MLYDALVVYRDMLHDEESTPEGSPGLSPLEELGARCPCCFAAEVDEARRAVDRKDKRKLN